MDAMDILTVIAWTLLITAIVFMAVNEVRLWRLRRTINRMKNRLAKARAALGVDTERDFKDEPRV